ncbi:MAG: hypothetical protein D6733_01165 [Methanobacteriota archaeon]|nr:MAG: hypothetical protein D6733_01165 [Euryarchaeota archaeon]
MISEKKIVAELSLKLAKSGLYTSKRGEEVEELARKLNVEVRKIKAEDREKVRKILSKGESLSKIVVQARGS